MLTTEQIATLKAAILAETNANVVQWRTPATRDDRRLTEWLNSASNTDAWKTAAQPVDIDDATDWVSFDTLSAGKRDSWAMFLARQRNFCKNAVRKWVTDIWGNATAGSAAEKLLQSGVEKALRGEVYLGGTSRTTGTVTALDRNYVGTISIDDVSAALNS
jgi:hypothetical protein